jgi:glycosyltransferase involved in cell wall biosynthesis
MAEPTITIVIPALNAGKVIAETLTSAQQQTFKDFEALVVIDTGSTDDTAQITQRFCEGDARFQLVYDDQHSIAAARNRGITQGRGEFIAFLDADDVWMPTKLEQQIKLFATGERLDVAFTNFYFWDGHTESEPFFGPNRPMPEGNIDQQIIESINRLSPNMSVHLMRKKTMVAAGYFDATEHTIEDWDLWLRMAERGLLVKGVAEPLARYRQWAGNATKQKLRVARANVEVLRKNRERSRRADLRALYDRALRWHRGNAAMIEAREKIEQQSGGVPRQILRAWQANPKEIKWLVRAGLTACPTVLGGDYFRNKIYGNILQRY